MPNSLTGLLIFVVLVAPGFVFVVVTERGPFARSSSSVLRETAAVALASLTCDVVSAAIYATTWSIGSSVWPWHIDGPLLSIQSLLETGSAGQPIDRVGIATTLTALVALACIAALVLASIVNNSDLLQLRSVRPARWVLPAKGARNQSAWWTVLREENSGHYRRVTCYLDDGSRVRGMLNSFNPSSDETEDRELVLGPPIRLTDVDGTHQYLKWGAVTVSARKMRFMHVAYYQTLEAPDHPPPDASQPD